jgi:ketosteroid isomerase-like protein
MAQGRPMVRGRDAIQKDSTAQIAEAGTQLEGKPFDSGMSGDLGYAAYSGIVTLKDGKKNPYHGVTVFRRVDGQWKAIIDASMDSVPQVKQ